MSSFVADVSKAVLGRIAAMSGVLLLCIVCSMPAVRADSLVQAIVCTAPATLSIERPVSDSVVTTTPIVVSGNVTQANQIEVTIDGQFNGVVPLNAAATSFRADVQVPGGTHTLTLKAIDACGIGDASASIVLTYQPADATPGSGQGSVGAETATDIPSTGGVVVGDAAPRSEGQLQRPTLFSQLLQPLVQMGRNLDIIPSDAKGTPGSSAAPLVRIGLLVSGFCLILFSSKLSSLCSGFTRGASARVLRLRQPLVIVAGCVLLLSAFLLG